MNRVFKKSGPWEVPIFLDIMGRKSCLIKGKAWVSPGKRFSRKAPCFLNSLTDDLLLLVGRASFGMKKYFRVLAWTSVLSVLKKASS